LPLNWLVGEFPTSAPWQRAGEPLVLEVKAALMQSEDNTQTLLRRWRSGSRDAGDRLLHRYVPQLSGFFGRRACGNADELVQRTLLACTQSLERFEGRSTFRTYLFGIARNQYLMHRREELTVQESVTPATQPEESPSQLVAVRQEHVILVLALRRVQPEFSIVLRRYYWEERSLDEIAVELGIPIGTVKSRLARGRASIKANLANVKLRDDVRNDALHELLSWFARREP
jgi:RNA polymerase sigma factor (sigma-70 family)